MKGWLVYNDTLQSDKYSDVHDLYMQAASLYNVSLQQVSNKEIEVIIMDGKEVIECCYDKPDFVLFLDKDIVLARQLEKAGYRLFNCADVIEICDNKATTMQYLMSPSIAMPKTMIASMEFNVSPTFEEYEGVVKKLKSPFIIKESYGSFGHQVYLIESFDMYKKIRYKIGTKPFIYQEYIESSKGIDVRIYVVFDEVVLAVKRENKDDFRANVSNGGTMYVYEPSVEMKAMAVEVCKRLGACFAGIDLLFGQQGQPILCEVNSNAHIKNVFDLTQVNVAKFIIEGVLHEIRGTHL